MKFRTKPFEIEAVQFTGENWDEVHEFTSPLVETEVENYFIVPTAKFIKVDDGDFKAAVFDELHNTWVKVKPNQWIIKGQKGEFYPCDDEIFRAKYEEVEPTGPEKDKAWRKGRMKVTYEPYFDSDFPETQ